MASDNITKVIKELELYWEELELNYFDHFMELTKFFTIYSEQLPRPELSYILVLILCCYYTATDKYLQSGLPLTRLDDKYLNLLAKYLNVEEMNYYCRCFKSFVATCNEALVLKQTLLIISVPAVRHSIWAEWRAVNIGMVPGIRLMMIMNFPGEDMHSALTTSSTVYVAIQCALLNHIASVIKDKSSIEVNYYLDVSLGAVEKQEEIFETSNKYIEAVDVSEKLRLVLRSTLHGNYLLYVYTHSKRYFGMTEPNQ